MSFKRTRNSLYIHKDKDTRCWFYATRIIEGYGWGFYMC